MFTKWNLLVFGLGLAVEGEVNMCFKECAVPVDYPQLAVKGWKKKPNKRGSVQASIIHAIFHTCGAAMFETTLLNYVCRIVYATLVAKVFSCAHLCTQQCTSHCAHHSYVVHFCMRTYAMWRGQDGRHDKHSAPEEGGCPHHQPGGFVPNWLLRLGECS